MLAWGVGEQLTTRRAAEVRHVLQKNPPNTPSVMPLSMKPGCRWNVRQYNGSCLQMNSITAFQSWSPATSVHWGFGAGVCSVPWHEGRIAVGIGWAEAQVNRLCAWWSAADWQSRYFLPLKRLLRSSTLTPGTADPNTVRAEGNFHLLNFKACQCVLWMVTGAFSEPSHAYPSLLVTAFVSLCSLCLSGEEFNEWRHSGYIFFARFWWKVNNPSPPRGSSAWVLKGHLFRAWLMQWLIDVPLGVLVKSE